MPEADTGPGTSLADELALLKAAAREAGLVAMRYFRRDPEVWMKGGTSPVSEADYAADACLRTMLLEARPDHGWLSEESVDDLSRLTARRTFVVDPIDGTRGFLEGQASWCVSVAIVEAGRPLVGVLECPARGETYWALPGSGAYRNGERIGVRSRGERIGIAGPKAMVEQLPQSWRERVERVTYIPSLAFRLAMIAGGRLDATFVKANAHDWDIAAADLILSEAGGRLLDGAGAGPSYGRPETAHGVLAAGSGDLLTTMVGVLADLPA